jgi:hypothetical protein
MNTTQQLPALPGDSAGGGYPKVIALLSVMLLAGLVYIATMTPGYSRPAGHLPWPPVQWAFATPLGAVAVTLLSMVVVGLPFLRLRGTSDTNQLIAEALDVTDLPVDAWPRRPLPSLRARRRQERGSRRQGRTLVAYLVWLGAALLLGHESVEMALVYIGLTDEDVREDYQKVLGPDAIVAGPGTKLVQSGEFGESEIRWLKEHYFQTELELGRCLRLPQEGPCECDLYLTCAKFVTTPEYAPRLRRRRKVELELIEDAEVHGWPREVERHRCTVRRLEQLLADLGEPLDGPETAD